MVCAPSSRENFAPSSTNLCRYFTSEIHSEKGNPDENDAIHEANPSGETKMTAQEHTFASSNLSIDITGIIDRSTKCFAGVVCPAGFFVGDVGRTAEMTTLDGRL